MVFRWYSFYLNQIRKRKDICTKDINVYRNELKEYMKRDLIEIQILQR